MCLACSTAAQGLQHAGLDRWQLLRRLWSHKGLLSLVGHHEFAFGMEFELRCLLYYFFRFFSCCSCVCLTVEFCFLGFCF